MRKSPVSPAKSLGASAVFHRRCGGDSTNRPVLCPSDTGLTKRRRAKVWILTLGPPEDGSNGARLRCYTVRLACRTASCVHPQPPPFGDAWQFRGHTVHMLPRPMIPLRQAASPAPLPPNGKRFHVWTIGCQMNEADSAKISRLQEAGYTATSDEQAADIVILNSCVVRQAAEDKVAGKLNSLLRLKRERPDVSVVLTGCMVTNPTRAVA